MSFGIAPGEGGFVLFVVKSALAERCHFGNDLTASRLMGARLAAAAPADGDGHHKKAFHELIS